MFSSTKGDLGLPSRRKTSTAAAAGPAPGSRKSRIPGPESKISLGPRPGPSSKTSLGPSSKKYSTGSLPTSKRSSQSRQSIIGQSVGAVKDPRPLSDKAYQQASIKKLRNFLIDEKYPREVRPKCLQSPSTKEFIFILNFILERIDPGLVISGLKIDEEIPYITKFLKYPFNISKNHLLSVGSPHSWPIMLGLLTWLIDLCLLEDQTDNLMFKSGTDSTDFFDDDMQFAKTDFEMINELYRLYLTRGPDDPDYLSLLETRKASRKSIYENVQAAVEAEKKRNEELMAELNELKESSITSLQQKSTDLNTMVDEKLRYLNEELGPVIEATENNTREIESQTTALECKIEETKENIGTVLDEIQNQPMSAKEAQNFHQKIKEKQDTVHTLKQRVDEAREGVFDLQRRHGKKVTEIVGMCKDVNDSLRKLSTIVPDAQCIPILDYNSSKRADPSVLSKLVHQAKTIRETIHKLDERIAKEIAEYDSKMISAESTISSIQNDLAMKEIEVENQEQEVLKGKDGLQRLRQKRQSEMKEILSSKLERESEIAELEEKLKDMELEQSLEKTKARYQGEYREVVESICEMTQSLQELCFAITSHFEKQRIKQKEFCAGYRKLVEMFKELEPPTVLAKYCPPEVLAEIRTKNRQTAKQQPSTEKSKHTNKQPSSEGLIIQPSSEKCQPLAKQPSATQPQC